MPFLARRKRRVREFTQAEIEHFVHPDDKKHAKFGSVAALAPLLYSRALQMGEVGHWWRWRRCGGGDVVVVVVMILIFFNLCFAVVCACFPYGLEWLLRTVLMLSLKSTM